MGGLVPRGWEGEESAGKVSAAGAGQPPRAAGSGRVGALELGVMAGGRSSGVAQPFKTLAAGALRRATLGVGGLVLGTPALGAPAAAGAMPALALDLEAVGAYSGPSGEIAAELALTRGQADGLEARLGELAATTFSTTTTLSVQATLVVGANGFSGTAGELTADSRAAFGATTANLDLQVLLDTSFKGNDLLRAKLRAGNFASSSFGGAGPSTLSQLEVAFQESLGDPPGDGSHVVAIDRLYYQVPLGAITLTAGGRVGQDDMVALWPSVYPAETVLDVFTMPGAAAAYNKATGVGAGLWWTSGGLAVSANYVAANGNNGAPAEGGVATSGAAGVGTVQIAYGAGQWALALVYAHVANGDELIPQGTPLVLGSLAVPGHTDAFALAGYWQPAAPGWWPSISAGWGLNGTSDRGANDDPAAPLARASQSWSVGVQWSNVLLPGNGLGVALGQPTFATRLQGGATPRDGGLIGEAWYKLRLSDAISLTPALFVLSRPLGQATPAGESFRQVGGLVKMSWRF